MIFKKYGCTDVLPYAEILSLDELVYKYERRMGLEPLAMFHDMDVNFVVWSRMHYVKMPALIHDYPEYSDTIIPDKSTKVVDEAKGIYEFGFLVFKDSINGSNLSRPCGLYCNLADILDSVYIDDEDDMSIEVKQIRIVGNMHSAAINALEGLYRFVLPLNGELIIFKKISKRAVKDTRSSDLLFLAEPIGRLRF